MLNINRRNKKKQRNELKRKSKRKHNKLIGLFKGVRQAFKPHPIARTRKEKIFSVYNKMNLRLNSKQNIKAGYVK